MSESAEQQHKFDLEIEPINFECRWAPLTQFTWRDDEGNIIGEYWPGNTYNCTRFPQHEKLRFALANWLKLGMVELYPLKHDQLFQMLTMNQESS